MTTPTNLKSSFRDLPPKLRIYAQCRLDGMNRTASAAAAGSKDPGNDGSKWERDERVQRAMIAAADQISEEVGFTRKEAHDLLMQAYMNAATATEQIAAVNSMIALHAIAKPKVIEHKHDHNHSGQIEHMPTDELLKLAELDDLTLDGEYEVVDSGEKKLIDAPRDDDRPLEDY